MRDFTCPFCHKVYKVPANARNTTCPVCSEVTILRSRFNFGRGPDGGGGSPMPANCTVPWCNQGKDHAGPHSSRRPWSPPEGEPEPSLFDIAEVPEKPGVTIQQRFEEFHAANPRVYAEITRLARHYQALGWRRIGIGHLVEILRWQRNMETRDPSSDFKLSNDYRSRYSRLIEEREPDLAGFFTVRELRSA